MDERKLSEFDRGVVHGANGAIRGVSIILGTLAVILWSALLIATC